ncbi:tetratricopeptide repeat protein [Falsiporphyromonas endometrii]|uniref:Tetratricopeptide repeat protein n=1 Tax=Falsiporphyromonas endometrii TaxID=1387297 RepID=A0ABV9K614_9PORP
MMHDTKQPHITKGPYTIILLVVCIMAILSFYGCNTKKNTAFNRFYQGFTTRYNVYYNGKNFFDEAYNNMIEGYKESFSQPIVIEPSSYNGFDEKKTIGGPYDNAITKARKAISLHSLRAKPEKLKINRRDKKQKAFLEKVEYNPFLHNAWMLLGKSQYYNGDYLEAMATFGYIARIYKTEPYIRDEAKLWQIRCYNALGWINDTDEIIKSIANPQKKDSKRVYNLAMAERQWKLGNDKEAVRHLVNAAKLEKNKRQRARLYYLAGQLAQASEMYQEARKAYKKVISLAPPFDLDLAARIRCTEVEGRDKPLPVAKKLERMARKEKYDDVQDQIYLAIGNTYMNIPDTAKAIKAYQLGADSSHLKAADYGLCNLKLGNIYYSQHKYTKAKPCFANALRTINKSNQEYERVDKTSSDLDALVVFSKQVEEQDSLQHLASLPEKDRLEIIDKAIKTAKEEAKRKAKEAEMADLKNRQDKLNQQADAMNPNRNNTPDMPSNVPNNGEFYFYNPPLMTQGKAAFEKKWGRRILEDNWRRSNKEPGFTAPEQNQEMDKVADSTSINKNGAKGIAAKDSTQQDLSKENDPFEREYYLKNLPLTPEAMERSNKIIEEGLFGMGKVFNEQMEKFEEAIYTYEELLKRFPKFEKRLDVLYNLYLLYARTNQTADAERCRQLILKEFPEDNLAKALQDKDYIKKLRAKYNEQNSIYDTAFNAYFKGDQDKVRSKYKELKDNFPTSQLLPKIAFLDALCYVLENDSEGFKKALQEVIAMKPDADISELAQSMLGDLLKGRRISQGGYKEMDWNIQFAGEGAGASAADSTLPQFDRKPDRYELRLIFPSGSIDRNAIIFAVSAFDYSRFTRYTLDAKLSEIGDWQQIIISDLPNASTAWFYIRQAYAKDGYMPKLIDDALLFPISKSNAELLQKGRSLKEYIQFVAQNYKGQDVETVLARWRVLTGQNIEKTDDKEQNNGDLQQVTESSKDKKIRSVRPALERDKKQVKETSQSEETIATDQEPSEEKNVEDKKATEEQPLNFEIDRKEVKERIKTDSTKQVETSSKTPIQKEEKEDKTQNVLKPVVTPNENVTYSDIKELYQDRKEEEQLSKREQEKIKRQKEKERKAELRQRERERKKQLKQRERERKEKLKQREKERKEREKERKRQLKEKEKERKEKLKLREKERKEKLKQRNS